jgi:diguanylate cyclase (GGDEF)-like protein
MARGVKKEINVTVSIGLASTNGERFLPAEVLRMADQALYKAKAKGRNCTVTARIKKSPGTVQPGIRAFSAG